MNCKKRKVDQCRRYSGNHSKCILSAKPRKPTPSPSKRWLEGTFNTRVCPDPFTCCWSCISSCSCSSACASRCYNTCCELDTCCREPPNIRWTGSCRGQSYCAPGMGLGSEWRAPSRGLGWTEWHYQGVRVQCLH